MSSINFCELDYQYSNLIAEYYNTLSNIIIIIIGYYGYYYHYKLHKIVNYRFIVLMIIGFGSFLFHATLSRFGQLLDEIPMLWLNAILLYEMNPSFLWLLWAFCISIAYSIFYRYELFLLSFTISTILIFYLPFRYVTKELSTKLLNKSLFLFILGFIKWIIDFSFCNYVHDYYLHAWWHLWSGLSVFYYIQFQLSLKQNSNIYPHSLLTIIKISE